MASKSNQRVRSHLQARIYLGSTNIGSGRLQSFDADHDFGTQAVHGVGDYEAAEHVYLKFNGTITLEAFMVRDDDLTNLKVAALGAGILELDVLDIYVKDEEEAIMRVYRDCTIQRYRESIREGQICGENATVFFRTADKGDGDKGDEKAPANDVTVPDPNATI